MQKKIITSVFFMMISPALALYEGLKSKDVQFKKWLLIIFITFFGSVITLTEENDGYRHWENVYKHYVGLSFNQFSNELINIITFKYNYGTDKDVFIHVLSYFTGGVLGLPQLFFVFVSFIYAYFFVSSMFKLIKLTPGYKYNWVFYGILIIFIFWKNIDGISTVRTWTGMWILFYGALSYYETKKFKYLLLMAVPPFVHVGYFIMAIPAWLAVIFKSHPRIYAIIFALSFMSPLVGQQKLLKQLEQNEVGKGEVNAYYRENGRTYQEAEGSAWYLQLQQMGLQVIAVDIITFMLIIFGAYTKGMNATEKGLFSIGLLTKALSNSTYYLFAVSSRSGLIAQTFILASLVLLMQRSYFKLPEVRFKRVQNLILACCLILLIPFFIFRIADMIYVVSIFLFFMPFIPWISNNLNVSVREALGYLIH